ncbi:hypothetical protein G6F31_020859 [Rhizopus arrhizus]|nr:hypothetical protein G6F31_020859 [Rhizopus arrhizus]
MVTGLSFTWGAASTRATGRSSGARRHAQPGAGPGALRGQPARHAGLGRPPRRGLAPARQGTQMPGNRVAPIGAGRAPHL